MGDIGSTEALILLVVLVAAGLVLIRSRVAAKRTRQTGSSASARVIAASPAAAAPQRSLESRLVELDNLRSRWVINDTEYASARQRAIEGSS